MTRMQRNLFWPWLIVVAVAVPALAIRPEQWVHTTEADFEPGETESTVVTNLGDVKLANRTEDLTEVLEDASIIYDMVALADGKLYLAAGPEAKLLRRDGDKVDKLVELEDEQVFCLDKTSDDKLLVAVSGPKARLAVLDGEELKDLAVLVGVTYIWDVIVDGQVIYAATGAQGKLFRVDLAAKDGPKIDELFDAAQANLLCLARDKTGRIFAGSDTDGLVYRFTINDKGEAEVFVVYDATEPEIGAVVILDDGTIYIGTADAEQAKPGRMEKPAKEETGRPDKSKDDKKEAPKAPKGDPAPKPMKDGEQKPGAQDKSAAEMPDSEAKPDEPKQAQAPEPDAKPAVTADQRNELRETMRKRLLAVREGGKLQAGSSPARRPTTTTSRSRTSRSSKPTTSKKGNAVYRITADGFVNEIFRESVMILKLLNSNGKLIIATGNEGQIYSVDVQAEETSMLVDLEPQQIPALIRGPEGHILLGTANAAQLLRLDPGFAEEGSYTSKVLDADQISQWGALNVTTDVPQGTQLQVLTRSGNVDDPEKAAWSPWSEPFTIEHDAKHGALAPRFAPITSDNARFLQYQLKLKGSDKNTPVVDRIEITYVVPNLKPQIKAIKATYAARKSSSKSSSSDPKPAVTELKLEWLAADPNKDPLLFNLEYQFAGTDVWLPLAEDLNTNRHEWETLHVPDGRYIVRVTATDLPGNPANMALEGYRTSDPILVDNSSPVVKIETPQAEGDAVKIAVTAADALSTIQSVDYNVNGEKQWHVVLPDDLIYDSTTEAVTIIIPDLESGRHAVTIRATDARGNAVYKAMFVNISKGKK